jgi:O-antigen/teichoic acid export membrane protein
MINGVTQPVLASVANDPQRQAAVFHKMLRFTAFISFPAMFGLSLIAKEFILITITDKWLASARIMQLLCIWGAFIPVNNLFSLLLVSRGRSSVFMFNSIALSVLQLITACISYPYGITTMIYLFVAINILWMFVWYLFARREIPLTLWSILKDIAPYFLLAASLTIAAHYITLGITSLYLSLAIKVVFVASLYALVLWKMQSVIFNECIQFIKKKKIS